MPPSHLLPMQNVINRLAHFFRITLFNSGHHKDSLTIGSLCPLLADKILLA